MASPKLLNVALIFRHTEIEVHVQALVALQLVHLLVRGHQPWVTQGLPERMEAGEKAVGRVANDGVQVCVHLTVTALTQSQPLERRTWQSWAVVGHQHVPLPPPWPQRLFRDLCRLDVVQSGQGPRRVITLINCGETTLRDVSVHLWQGDVELTGLLQGQCPQRIAEQQRVTLVLEHHGLEEAFVLSVRYVSNKGYDHCTFYHLVVGRPAGERPRTAEPSRAIAFPLPVAYEE